MENAPETDEPPLPKSGRRWSKRTEWIVVIAAFLVSIPVFYLVADYKAERHNTGVSPHLDRKGEHYHIVFDYDQHPYLNGGRQLKESNYTWVMPRHRMPGYSYILSLFWDPDTAYPKTREDPRKVSNAYFEKGKQVNIILSIIVLIVLFAVLRAWFLPSLEAFVVTWGFGWFLAIFKAPYVQPENLFYLMFTLTFLLCWSQLHRPTWVKGLLAGLVMAGTYGLKSATSPLLMLFVTCFALKILFALFTEWRQKRAGDRDAISWKTFGIYIARGAVTPIVFFALLAPYFINTAKIHGDPFWEVHSKYYMWMNDREEKYKWRDLGIADPDFKPPPGEDPPTLQTYLENHSIKEIYLRFRNGVNDLRARVRKDYTRAYYLAKNVVLVGAIVICLLAWRRFLPALRDRWPEVLYVLGFFIGYSHLYGWYERIGVGPRLMLGLYLPFLVTALLLVYRFGDEKIKIPKTKFEVKPRYVANAVFLAYILINLTLVISKDIWAIEGGR